MPQLTILCQWIAFSMILAGCQATNPVRSTASHKDILVLSGFDPFGGDAKNYSYDVAQEIARHPEWISDREVDIRVCLLPTIYDQGAHAAHKCLDQLPSAPQLMISLGEGGCGISLETTARNIDQYAGFADNAGTVRDGTTIVAGAPARLGFTLPTLSMYCALSEADRPRVRVSYSEGFFVCNNTSYWLQHDFLAAAKRTGASALPYGFIHVPASTCKPEQNNVHEVARIVAAMVRVAWLKRDEAVLPHPASPSEVAARNAPGIVFSSACEADYWRALERDIARNRYAN